MHVMTPTAAALLACLALIACGGGGDWQSMRIEASTFGLEEAPTPAQVGLEGCVVDAQDRPLAQSVQALGSDGRLVASGASGADGVFRLSVPARSVLRVETFGPGADGMTIMTGNHPALLGGCLHG